MTSGRPLWHQPIFVLAFLTWAVDATTIENCYSTVSDIIRIDSPKAFQCQDDPLYKMTPYRPELEGALFHDEYPINEWKFSVKPTLNLNIGGICPSLIQDVVCYYSEMRISSRFDAKDGGYFMFQGQHRFGEVHWFCNATDENRGKISVAFFFFIVGTQTESESDFTYHGAQFLKNVLWNAGDYYTTNRNDLDIMKLQKFDKVTSDTEIIFYQGYHQALDRFKIVLFTSEDVAIKVSETQYNIMTSSGPPSYTRVTGQNFDAYDPCEHYYKLVFNGEEMTKCSREVFLFILALSFMVIKIIE